MVEFAEELTDRLRLIPGVHVAAYGNQLPMVGLRDTAGGLWKTADTNRKPTPTGPDGRFVSRQYFEAFGIQTIAGRGFEARDGAGQPRVLILNAALAKAEFADENPSRAIGVHRSRPHSCGKSSALWRTCDSLVSHRPLSPSCSWTCVSRPRRHGPLFPAGAYYAVQTTGEPFEILPGVRRAVHETEPEAALFHIAPMTQLVSATIARPRMYALLLGIFAAVGVTLAVVGLYGLLAYTVTQRTKEIAIRMAIGASPSSILAWIVRQGLVLTSAGVAVGLIGAVSVTRYLEGMLFGLTPLDPSTFIGVSLMFVAVASLASYVPARRATRFIPRPAGRPSRRGSQGVSRVECSRYSAEYLLPAIAGARRLDSWSALI